MGQDWVLRDLDSDNGIRAIRFATASADALQESGPAVQLEFMEELYCCVGAVVLKMSTLK
jgi:hypothetical protein